MVLGPKTFDPCIVTDEKPALLLLIICSIVAFGWGVRFSTSLLNGWWWLYSSSRCLSPPSPSPLFYCSANCVKSTYMHSSGYLLAPLRYVRSHFANMGWICHGRLAPVGFLLADMKVEGSPHGDRTPKLLHGVIELSFAYLLKRSHHLCTFVAPPIFDFDWSILRF